MILIILFFNIVGLFSIQVVSMGIYWVESTPPNGKSLSYTYNDTVELT